MSNRVKRRPMPLDESVHWKPLRDSHYIVASLQPADGGRRQIFVQQSVLVHAQASARGAQARRTFGLFLGHFFECSVTGTDFMVIDKVVEHHLGSGDHATVAADTDLATVIERALAGVDNRGRAEVLGWYCVAGSVEANPSPGTASLHASYFPEPWQTVLVLAPDAHHRVGGTFFLHDSTNARWFYAPFYELADAPPEPNRPKTTYLSWPQYMTAEAVVPVHLEPPPAPAMAPDPAALSSYRDRNPLAPPPQEAPSDIDLAQPGDETIEFRPPREPPIEPHTTGRPGATPPAAHLGPNRQTDSGVEKTRKQRLPSRLADREVENTTVVDGSAGRAVPTRTRSVSDGEDTSAGDDPAHYIELARSEGFFVATRFEASNESAARDVLWVLNEPYSGLLLTVVTSAAEVVDASLHYNLQTDDAGLLRAPFPEHRDPDSKTIYVRETCVDGLRERCRRLRATNALVREWKVSPALSFLTPGEWQSAALLHLDASQAAVTVSELNKARLAELPEGVRDQFRLARETGTGPRPA